MKAHAQLENGRMKNEVEPSRRGRQPDRPAGGADQGAEGLNDQEIKRAELQSTDRHRADQAGGAGAAPTYRQHSEDNKSAAQPAANESE